MLCCMKSWMVARRWLWMVTVWVAGVSGGLAAAPEAPAGPAAPSLSERVDAIAAGQLKAFEGREDILLRRGLVADRAERRVTLLAAPTGVASNSNVEFLLVAAESGHHYEAFAYCFVKPSEVREALTFIGMTPGRSVDPQAMAFWPKGERVLATVRCLDPGPWDGAVRMERLVWSDEKGVSMREAGFVFTGSRMGSTSNGVDRLWADIRDPMAILANYNEPDAVLELPRIAPQNAVYAMQLMHPDFVPATNVLLEVVLTPERLPGAPRVLDLEVTLLGAGDAAAVGAGEPLFQVREAATNDVPVTTNMLGVLRRMTEAVSAGRDPYVRLGIAPAVPLGLVREVCLLLAAAEGEDGFRFEPPLPGSLFLRAYIPEEKNRQRDGRVAQPWELHLRRGEGGETVATLVAIAESWAGDNPQPTLSPSSTAIATPEALRTNIDAQVRDEFRTAIGGVEDESTRSDLLQRLEALPDAELWTELGEKLRFDVDYSATKFSENKALRLRVVLVFADLDMTHGELMRWINPILGTHPTQHVYLERATNAPSLSEP